MNRWVVLLLIVLLGALVAVLGRNEFGDGSGDAVERRDAEQVAPPLAGDEATLPTAADPGPTLAGDASGTSTRPSPSTVGNGKGLGPTDEDGVAIAATYTGEVPTGWHAAPPAQRPHAIRPPRPRGPAVGPGGSSGGVGPTGHWSRFPPAGPPRGDATLHVEVVDEHGAPVPGADVYLGPPGSLQAEAVSFGDLRRLGATDARGDLTAPDLPAGAAVLAANVANLLNGPRGLDARSAIPVLLVSRAAVRGRVTLPLDTGAFGTVSGRVVDAKGRPIARAEIRCGFFRIFTDADGRFEAPHLPAGEQSVSARRSGYATGSAEVDVPRGGTREVEIVLTWAESGGLRLEGRVLTAEGAGLADATVYLIDESGRGTLRSVTSGAEGRYVFEDLPERLRTTALRVQAGKHREGYQSTTVELEGGLTDDALDIRLPPRQVRVRFWLRDAGTGAPIDRCRVEVERLDDPEASPRGFTGSRPDGVFEHFYPAGRYRFGVEAPDRETQVVEADLAPPGGDLDLAVAFPSTGEPAVEVTLRVTVRDLASSAPVTECSILVLDAHGTEVARFVGGDPEGQYSLPAPSGAGTLQVSAAGYETAEEAIDLPTGPLEAEFVSYLAPR
jgi:hypothetical protein